MWYNRNGFDFDGGLFAEEGSDADEGGGGRIFLVDEGAAKFAKSEKFFVVEADDVIVKFDEVFRFCTCGRESGSEIGESLRGLGAEVVLADHFSLLIETNLTRDENEFAGIDDDGVGVAGRRV